MTCQHYIVKKGITVAGIFKAYCIGCKTENLLLPETEYHIIPFAKCGDENLWGLKAKFVNEAERQRSKEDHEKGYGWGV